MKTLLILTGPQGSGNHLWSKIFALHRQVLGWRSLNSEYQVGHDQEPWAHYWQYPADLKSAPWGISDWHVTSVTVPCINNRVPDFKGFVTGVQNLGHRVKFAVLGRDQNILNAKSSSNTLQLALDEYSRFAMPTFLSYELLHLYGRQYLQKVEKELEFPVDYNNSQINEILKEDANTKYFQMLVK